MDPDALIAATRAAPHLDPNVVFGIAGNADPGSTPDLAQATHAFGSADKYSKHLKSLDSDVQSATWANLSDADRQMLTSSGYKPPGGSPGSHRSLIGSVGHLVSRGFGDVTAVPVKVAGEALHVAGAPLRAVQHLYRAATLIDESVANHGWSPEIVTKAFNPSDWSEAWRQSTSGEHTFLPKTVQNLVNERGQDTVALATKLASGQKIDDIVLSVPEDQRNALVQRIQNDAQLKDTVSQLNAAKISFGRRLAGQSLLLHHPLVGKFVSGAGDAAFDWYGDPTIWAAKSAQAFKLARYAVQTPEDVNRLWETSKGFQNVMNDAAKTLDEGGADALIKRYPKAAPIAQHLVDEGVSTGEQLKDWTASQTGFQELLKGNGFATLHKGETVAESLSKAGAVGLDVKEAAKTAIDWSANTVFHVGGQEIRGIPVVRALRRMTTLIPAGKFFDPESPNALTTMQRLASMAGLTADHQAELVNAFAAAPEQGAKFDLYRSLIDKMGEAGGLKDTVEARDYLSKYKSALDASERGAIYSPVRDAAGNPLDQLIVDGREMNAGLLENQLTNRWAMPNYKDWNAFSARNRVMEALYGKVNSEFVSGMMDRWKGSTLARIGFPVRAGGEEAVGFTLMNGMKAFLGGHLANVAEGANDDRTVAARLWQRVASHLPREVQENITTPVDAIAHVMGDRTSRAMRGVAGALSSDDYIQAARELADHEGPLFDSFSHEVSARHGRAAGYLDDRGLVQITKQGGKTVRFRLAPAGEGWKTYAPTDEIGVSFWQDNLDELANSTWGRKALETQGLNREERIAQVADSIEHAPKTAAKGARFNYVPDGQQARVVGVDATQRQATEDWATRIIDHADGLVSRGDSGENLADLHRFLLDERKAPPIDTLNAIPEAMRPGSVKGPELVPVPINMVSNIMENMFDHIGRMMDTMIREPATIHNYALAKQTVERGLAGIELADKAEVVSEIARERAVNMTIPFIHDPHVRSQFDVANRNIAPFMFAQVQFYKRWARIFQHSPEAFREAQLTMMGLRHSGIVQKDENGNDYFVYPLANQVQDVLTKGIKTFTGHDISLPLPVQFTGQVRFATPGTERLGAPSFGPLVSVGMHVLRDRFPELTDVEQAVSGERGAGRSYWEQVLPTTLTRFIHFAMDKPETSPQMASAMMQTFQYLEAAGKTPPENATPLELERFNSRVKSWTRVLFFNRMLFGYSVPASPELQLDPNNLSTEYRQLLSQLPFDQAQKEFIRRHPDANAYTVFQSTTAAGAPLPATKEAVGFMENHTSFLKAYPQASAYFLPQNKGGQFDPAAYREQFALQMRTHRSLEEFERATYFQDAADPYFKARDARDAALASHANNPAAKQQITNNWNTWKQAFDIAHPIFNEELQSPDGRIRRQKSIDQIHAALQDPRLPQTDQTREVSELIGMYDQYQQLIGRLTGNRTALASSRRQMVTNAFVADATAYITAHPGVEPLYNRTIRPEVSP